jgi:NADPH:quinone reductase-like Zn-dependent oxidoreductase
MKAVILDEYGGPEVLRYGDAPDPVAGEGEIVVAVRAASVNAADYKVRRGGHYNICFPHILGRDFSGVVDSVGAGVTEFVPGDAVFGVLQGRNEGTYAEKVVANASVIARKPDWLSDLEAAALALTGLTALWAIEDTGQLQRGETVLIQGGAGGVAGVAIQIAHHLGARVITTASASNHDYVRRLGADQAIDYHSEDFTKVAGPCDMVFDTVGGEVQARSYEVLKPGGRLVRITEGPPGFTPPRSDVQVLRPAVHRTRAHLERLLDLVKAGVVSAPPIRRFKLAEASAAHRISEGRHLQGKLVLEVG